MKLAGLVFGGVMTGALVVMTVAWAVSQVVEESRRRRSHGGELASLIMRCEQERDSVRRDEGTPRPRAVSEASRTSADRLIHDRRPPAGSHDRRPQRRQDRAGRTQSEQA